MASLLESLAMGLRGAGGVLSPDVYRQNAAQEQQQAQLRQQLQMQQYQQRIKDEREQALGAAVRPFLDKGDLRGAAAAAASTPGGFNTGMTLLGQDEQRQARAETLKMQLQQRADELTQRHQQAVELAKQRGADQRALAEMNNQFRQQMLQFQQQGQQALVRITASLKPERQAQVITNDQGSFERQPDGTWKPVMVGGKPIAGKPPKADKPLTEFQGTSMLYGTRSAEADNILTDLEDKIINTSLWVKQKAGAVGRAVMTAEERQIDQAQRNFLNAVLRRESGAVISQEEFENGKIQYFPQPGDDEQTIANKRKNRETAIAGFQKMAGPGGEDVAAIRAKKRKPKDKDGGSPAPAGVDQALWDEMKPEEKALWPK